MKNKILFLIAIFVLAACGDDESTSTQRSNNDNNVNNVADMGGDTRPAPENNNQPPPPPRPIVKYLTVDITPGRSVYTTGLNVLPEVQIYDIQGELIDGAGFEVTIDPPTATMPAETEGRFTLIEEGGIEFTVCATLLGLDDEQICDTDYIVVDDNPPTIEITAPMPGDQLDANGGVITVEGTVSDTNGVPRLFREGQEIPLDNGAFSVDVPAEFGINHIELQATDGINATTTTAALDVIWAGSYEPVSDTQPLYSDPRALVFRLGQNFMDDGVKTMREQDGTFVTKDLADVLELLLTYVDLQSQIPDPVVNSSGFQLRVPSVTAGKPRIEVDITDTGMDLFIQIDELTAVTEGGIDLEGQVISLDGSIDAKFSALASISVSKASPTAPVVVNLDQLALAVESVTPNFVAPEANAIFTLAQSVLRTTLEDLLRDAIEGAFVDQLPALIQDLFTTLDTSLRGQSLDLDLGLGTPVTLNLDLGIDSLTTTFRSAIDAEMSGQCSVDGNIVGPTSRGVALDPGDTGTVPLFESSRIQIGLRGAFANGLLHTIWSAGVLELDARDQIPLNVERADLSAKLPPIIRGPKQGVDGALVVQLGQVELDVELLGSREKYGVFIETGMELVLVDNALTVQVSDTPVIRTWLISKSDDDTILNPGVLEDLVLSLVYPQLIDAVSNGLALELPALDLSGLGNLAPPLANLVLNFNEVRPIDYRDGHIMIDAELEGRL